MTARSRLLTAIWLAFSLLVATELKAEPKVLFDSGRTTAIEPYMAPLEPKQQTIETPPPLPAPTLGNYGLPIETPSMTPGKVYARTLPGLQGKMAGARPLFLIGADKWSLQWLQQHQPRLVELNAVGMVVAVATENELTILRQAAGDLPLMPASAEAIAQQWQLQHYPLLIAPPGVIAQ